MDLARAFVASGHAYAQRRNGEATMSSQLWQRLVGGFRSVLGPKPGRADSSVTVMEPESEQVDSRAVEEPDWRSDPAPRHEQEEADDSTEQVAEVQAALDRSLAWRSQLLLERSAGAAQLGDGPAIVTSLRDPEGGAIRQIPFAAQQALAVSRNPKSSVRDLVKLFERDPTLAQSLLKTANSAWYQREDEAVVSITAGVQRIGLKAVENVLLTSIVAGMLCRPGGTYGVLVGKVWSHMLRTAPLAQRLAPAFGVNPEMAYTLALLHDVGKLAVFDYISALRQGLHREIRMPETFLNELLVRLHEPVGGRAALRWGLGARAARALAEHHRHPVPDTTDPLTELLYVAERLDLAAHVRFEEPDWAALWADGTITTDRAAVEQRYAEESN
jgi:putative nucleotidyltransferase with HDIG domain